MGVQGWSSWDAEHCGWKLRLCPHLLGQLGTDSLQCPAQVQEFTHFSLGSRIHSSAVLQACANGPLVPNTEPGSWVDSESNETLLALSNYTCGNTMQNRPQSFAVGTHGAPPAPGLQATLPESLLPHFIQASDQIPLSWRPSLAAPQSLPVP